jgi:hypothetical protein
MIEEQPVTLYKEECGGGHETADNCEEHDYEYIAAAMASMFLIIPHPFATVIAVNGWLRHITAAHRMLSGVFFFVWDGFWNTALASYINLHACAQPLSAALTAVGISGIIVSRLCVSSIRTQVLLRVLLVQTPGFVAFLHFSLVC